MASSMIQSVFQPREKSEGDVCPHSVGQNDEKIYRDLIIVMICIIAVFVIREGLAWFMKTNHIHSEIRKQNSLLKSILEAVRVES